MDPKNYIEKKINEYEKKIDFINECLEKHKNMPINENRNRSVIIILNKSKMAYDLCLREFYSLKEYMQ